MDYTVAELVEEVRRLRDASNFPFTQDYINLGMAFTMQLRAEKPELELRALVSEAFGMAAIAYFQGGYPHAQ